MQGRWAIPRRPRRCSASFQLAPESLVAGAALVVTAGTAAAEALTSVLITINRRYKVRAAGIRITGIPDAEAPST